MKSARTAQDPNEYIQQFTQRFSELSRDAQQAMRPASAAPPVSNSAPKESVNSTLFAFMEFQTSVGELIREQVMALDLKQRDNEALAAKVEELVSVREGLVADLEKIQTRLQEQIDQNVTIKSEHATALATATTERATEKAELEGKIAAAATERATEKAELEGQIAAKDTELEGINAQLATLKTELEALKTEKEQWLTEKAELEQKVADAETNAQTLGAKKLGLVKPAPKAEGEPVVASTEKGEAIAATKPMTIGAAALAASVAADGGVVDATGADGKEVLAGLLKRYMELKSTMTKSTQLGAPTVAADTKAFIAFMNDPVVGCEGCAADPRHHNRLIVQAISARDELAQLIA